MAIPLAVWIATASNRQSVQHVSRTVSSIGIELTYRTIAIASCILLNDNHINTPPNPDCENHSFLA